MTHYDAYWGSLHALSTLTKQKTIKAACGKRVPFKTIIDRGVCECPECRAKAREHVNDSIFIAGEPYGSEESRARLLAAAVVFAKRFNIEVACEHFKAVERFARDENP